MLGRESSASPSPLEVKRSGRRFALSDGPNALSKGLPASATSTLNTAFQTPAVHFESSNQSLPGDVLPDAPPLLFGQSAQSPSVELSCDGDEDEGDGEDEEEWRPPSSKTSKSKLAAIPRGSKRQRKSHSDSDHCQAAIQGSRPATRSSPERPDVPLPSHSSSGDDKNELPVEAHATTLKLSSHEKGRTAQKLGMAFLGADDALDEAMIIPDRKAQQKLVRQSELPENSEDVIVRKYVPDVGEPGTIKKKKR